MAEPVTKEMIANRLYNESYARLSAWGQDTVDGVYRTFARYEEIKDESTDPLRANLMEGTTEEKIQMLNERLVSLEQENIDLWSENTELKSELTQLQEENNRRSSS